MKVLRCKVQGFFSCNSEPLPYRLSAKGYHSDSMVPDSFRWVKILISLRKKLQRRPLALVLVQQYVTSELHDRLLVGSTGTVDVALCNLFQVSS